MVTMHGDKNPDGPSTGTVHTRLKTNQFILSSANLSRSLTSLCIVAVCLLQPFTKLNLTSWKMRKSMALKNPWRNSWTVLAGLSAVEIPSKTKWKISSFSCIICRIGERFEFNLKSRITLDVYVSENGPRIFPGLSGNVISFLLRSAKTLPLYRP